MEEVLGNTSSLSLPVQPDSTCTVVNVVAAVNTVDCGMHFNSTDFSTSKILLVIDVVNVVIFNQREYSAKVSYNTCLSAVVDITAAYNV